MKVVPLDKDIESLRHILFGFEICKSVVPIAIVGLSTTISRTIRNFSPEKWSLIHFNSIIEAMSGYFAIIILSMILYYVFLKRTKKSILISALLSIFAIVFYILSFAIDAFLVIRLTPELAWMLGFCLPGIYVVYVISRIGVIVFRKPTLLQGQDWKPLFGSFKPQYLPYALGLGTHRASSLKEKVAIGLAAVSRGFIGVYLIALMVVSSSPIILIGTVAKNGYTILIYLIFAYVLIFLFGAILFYVARRLYQSGYEKLRVGDSRAPVLFLRSFRDDQVQLQKEPDWWYTRFLTPVVLGRSLEHLIQDELVAIGPVVAIGNPKDKLPPLGATRAYVKGEKWEDVVQSIAEHAVIIVLVVDETEGVQWELSMLRERGLLQKTILFFPPAPEDIVRKRSQIMVDEILGLSINKRADRKEVFALHFADEGSLPVAYATNNLEQSAYKLALRRSARAVGVEFVGNS